jgi:integrase
MAKDWRIGSRRFGRDESTDSLIRKSIVEREPGTEQIFFDDKVTGFGLKITAKDHRSFIYQYRTPERRYAIRHTFKGVHSVAQARALAADMAAGRYHEAAERPSGNPETLQEVVDAFFQLKSSTYAPLSIREIRRSLALHVLPTLGSVRYEDINRRDLARLRDGIIANVRQAALARAKTPEQMSEAQDAGRHAAHGALKVLNTIWNKYYSDHASDNFTWPKVRSPLEPEDRNGSGRALSDGEIRQFWHATFKLPAHRGAYYRFLLLTGMRLKKAARITREWLDGEVLNIPGRSTKPPYALPLSNAALELLHAHWGTRWAFEPLGPFGPLKTALDRQIGKPFAHWTNHDLRHSTRSLLSRITSADVAELALGHTLKGVRRTYDHHSYMEEKKAAMEALAALLAKIVEGSGSPEEEADLIRGA